MDKPSFVYVTFINTTPEKLWAALTSGEFTNHVITFFSSHVAGRPV
jgi:hypothetical protein